MAADSMERDEEETRRRAGVERLGDEDRDDQKVVRGDEKEEGGRGKRGKRVSV